jgi:hypothetical protein
MVFVPDSARDAAAIANGTAAFGQLVIIGCEDAAFAGGEVFARLK